MSSNSFGIVFCVTTFGESHGRALGAVVDGMPALLPVSEEIVQKELELRRPGRTGLSSPRSEPDRVEILSGVFGGRSTGAPIAMLIGNRDARPDDYQPLASVFRPGHADWSWQQKYGIRDWRGGGRASGRETVARVAAGALARIVLNAAGIEVRGLARTIGGIEAQGDDLAAALVSPLRCPDPNAEGRMEEVIRAARSGGDSVGGVIEVHARGLPAGLGEPLFDKLDARLGAALLSVGGIKGVELGSGFAMAGMRGSDSNDPMDGPGSFASNRAGGVLGGISTGAELVVRCAVKPTPSISRPQQTLGEDGQLTTLAMTGRHDPCLVPRVVAVAEAMVCLTLADFLLLARARQLHHTA